MAAGSQRAAVLRRAVQTEHHRLNHVATVTQAATVTELAAANPSLNRLQLYAAATGIGRAHTASMANTTVFAYAGASLPLLLPTK